MTHSACVYQARMSYRVWGTQTASSGADPSNPALVVRRLDNAIPQMC